MRKELEALRDALAVHGEPLLADSVQAALDGDESELDTFMVSNDLWGGSGSIADQAGLPRSEGRRAIEAALINLGEQQTRRGVANVRTEQWVDAFRSWARRGI